MNGKTSHVCDVKMAILPKLIYSSAIPIKKPNGHFFKETGKADPKIHMEFKGLKRAKTILKKNQIRRVTFPDFKFCHTAAVIK